MYSNEQLNKIYDRTSGYCHICHKKLAFKNYAAHGKRAAWEVKHSRAKTNGGSSRLNNLYPACIGCNRSKGTKSTRHARAFHNKVRAPVSNIKRKQIKVEQALSGGILGATAGGIIIGGIIGASKGYRSNPEKYR